MINVKFSDEKKPHGLRCVGCIAYDSGMYKKTACENKGTNATMSLVDSVSTMDQISAETIRLGQIGEARVVFQSQAMLDQWRQRVAAGESLRLRQH